jgi:hypothetical protein
MHFARPQIEVNLVKGENPRESLRYAPQFEEGEFEEGRTSGARRSVPSHGWFNHNSLSVECLQSTMKVGLKSGGASDDP